MALIIESRVVEMGKAHIIYKGKAVHVIGNFFAEAKATQRETRASINQPSKEVLEELVNQRRYSAESLAYIANCWEKAEEQDARFKKP